VKKRNPARAARSLSSFIFAVVASVLLLAPAAGAQTIPYYDNGNGSAVVYDPVPWPAENQWIEYLRSNDSINDQRTQDPSNGGTSPQAYVNVSSGCSDTDEPSVYYYYDAVNKVILYRWRVENAPNNYATGPSPGAFRSTSPWNSGQWTVLFDLNGDGFRDFAVHLNGSSGDPSKPVDVMTSAWSSTLSNSIDYVEDPANIHRLFNNYTAFVQGTSGNTTNQLVEFDGLGQPTTIQWPNGSSETVWDYGTTRAVDISTSSCREYFVDYQIPLAMLDASAFGGPTLDENTVFSFVFATANSLNNPFQKDVVLQGEYVCPPSSPAPFGDPLTLAGGIIDYPLVKSVSVGAGSCSAIPLRAQIIDTLVIENCTTVTTLTNAKFVYYYDANGNGNDDDGGTWTDIADTTNRVGTTIQADWNTTTLIRGQYLIAVEAEDEDGNITRSWLDSAVLPVHTNFPAAGVSPATEGTNWGLAIVGAPCGTAPPTMTKQASDNDVMAGDDVDYTLTITNTSSVDVTVSTITDTLPAGFAYDSNIGGTLGSPSASPAGGAIGTISWTFPGGTTVPAGNSRTFIFRVTAGTSSGTFRNSATAVTNYGTVSGTDTTGVRVNTANLTLTKFASVATDLSNTPVTKVQRGESVKFTLTYSNPSDIPVNNVVLSDVLPAGFLYTASNPAATTNPGPNTNGTVTWNLGTLAANSGPFSVTVTATASQSGGFTNTATLASDEAPDVTASANIYVTGPVLAIQKTASSSTVALPATNVDYTITYSNVGDAAAAITTLTDVVPTGFTLVTGAPTTSGCTQSGTTITCNINATLNAGSSNSITLRFNIATTAPVSSTNTATVNASNAASVSAQYTLTTLPASNCNISGGTAGTTISTYFFHNTSTDVSTASSESVGYINVTTAGAGYTSAPTVGFLGGGGSGAAATAVIRNGAVVGINVTNGGTGYTSAPTVTLTGGGFSATAIATAVLTSTQRTANTTAPTSATASTTTTFVIPTTPVEVGRWYSDVVSTTQAYAVNTITGASLTNAIAGLYIDKNGAPQVQGRLTLYAYNPATHAMTQLGQGLTESVAGNKNNELHRVTTMTINTGAVLPAGWRFLWTLEYFSANQDNEVTFRYDGTASQSGARVCMSPVMPSISKTVDKFVAVPGTDTLTYTITYRNPTSTTITGATVSDPIPAGLTFSSSTPSPTTNSGGILTWSLGDLAANTSGTITVTFTTSKTPDSFETNTATLSTTMTGSVSASATTQYQRPEVDIVKTISDDTLVPGQAFSYTIAVTNNGNAAASGVVVTDTLPSYISSTNFTGATNTVAVVNVTNGGSYVTAPTVSFGGGGGAGAAGTAFLAGSSVAGVTLASGGTGYSSAPTVTFSSGTATATSQLAAVSVAGSDLTFTLSGNLAAGATAYYTINATVATSGIPAGETLLTNVADVVDTYDTTPREATANATLTANPVLTLTETATPSNVGVQYVNVTAGGTWTTIPTVSFTGGGCTGVTGVVSVTGTPGNYSVTGVTITDPGTGCTSAPTVVFTGSGAGGATATPTIGPGPGDTITYVLTVTNTGNADATGVVVFDAIPNYTAWTSGGSFNFGTVSFNVGTLAPNTPTQVTYTVAVGDSLPKGTTALDTSGGATSTNTASPAPVSTSLNTGAAPGYAIDKAPDDELKPFPVATLSANATAASTVTVASTRLVETGSYVVIGSTVAKVVRKTSTTIEFDPTVSITAPAGTNVLQAIEYTINYENFGSATGTNVVVTDTLPANLGYAGIPGDPGDYPVPSPEPAVGSSGTLTWNIGTLVNGETGVIKLLAYATVAGTYTNSATISDGTALNTYNDTDTATTTFGALDPVKITSTPSVINQSPTNVANWTITVSNPLSSPATNVAVIDNLPEGFTYQSGSTLINGVSAADPLTSYVAGLVLDNGGSGYTSAPTVNISGSGCTAATATAYITGGVVTSLVVNNPGYACTGTPIVSFSGGGGSGASATAVISTPSTSPQWHALTIPANGSITIEFDADISSNVAPGRYQNEILVYGTTPSLTFDYLGTSIEDVQVCVPPPIVSAPPACGGSAGNVASIPYQPGATVTWSITNGNGTITTASTGTVHSVSLGSGGSGYTIAPAISFTGGGGSGAAATATVAGGVITAITVTNPGSGYTSEPTVVITPNGSGSDAAAAAVLGQGIIYTAGASGTVNLLVNVVREFSSETAACSVNATYNVTIDPSPTITSNPIDDTVCNNTLAQFTATAANATAYQWQVSTNGGVSYSDISGATASTYAFTALNADSGKYFRVKATRGPGCEVFSTGALLTVSCTPDVAVIQNDDTPDPVNAGENITYTQEVQNIGPVAATNPTFTQTTPAGTTFVSITPPSGWTCGTTPSVGGTGAITCTANAATLASNATSGDFVLVLKVNESAANGATITDTASVSMTEVDPSPSNNSKTAETLVQRRVDVAVTKDNDASLVPYGDDVLYTGGNSTPLTYTIVVTNNGPSLATNVTVTDDLPDEFVYDHTNNPAATTQGSCSYDGDVLTCAIGSLTNGETETITVPGTTSVMATEFTNTANVTRTETDTNAANDSASSTVTVVAATAVEMFQTDAVATKSGVTITWSTTSEYDNMGFNVYRSVSGGQMEQINKHMILGSKFVTGRDATNDRSYRFKDPKGTSTTHYYIEDVDLRGVRTMHGPVSPRIGNDDATDGPVTDPDPGLGSAGGIIESPRGIGVDFAGRNAPLEQRINQQWHLVSGQAAAKVIVTQTGWVRVSKRELVAAGYDPGRDSKGLGVFADGIEVPIEVNDGGDNKFDDADTIEFFGTSIDTPTAGGHVYYVTVNKGKAARVKKSNGAKSGTAAPKSFNYTYTRKERQVYLSFITNQGETDPFYGTVALPWPMTTTLKVENLDTTGADAQLDIVMIGASYAGVPHIVNVTLNGRPVATMRFTGMDRHVEKIRVPVSWLQNGDNQLGFISDNWDDISVMESARLTYPHLFRADDGALAFTVNALTEVNVAGFANDNVKAVDLTNANEPLRLEVKMSAAADGTRQAKVVAPDTGMRTILVYADARVTGAGQVVLNQPSSWNDMKNEADLVIVTNRAFLDAAAKLKKAREAEGLATAVVDVQNVYDEYSFGEHGPKAIRDFFERTQKWKRAPRYAILLGDASYDARNYYSYGNYDFVPTKLVNTVQMKTSSDDWLADFNDDGIPSIAIGRISVRTAAEAHAAVDKILRRGSAPPSGAPWTSVMDLIVDRPEGAPFEKSADYVSTAVPQSIMLNRQSFKTTSDPASMVRQAFDRGQLVMNYIGHGSQETWNHYSLTSLGAAALRNGEHLPFIVASNCLNGHFHDLWIDALGEALLRNGNGGASGVWASSTLTSPAEQTLINAEFLRHVFAGARVGDAAMKAKAATKDKDTRLSFILFGDPTMRLK
jgi:uncharacterized repeat protein (TIGR01451 family)